MKTVASLLVLAAAQAAVAAGPANIDCVWDASEKYPGFVARYDLTEIASVVEVMEFEDTRSTDPNIDSTEWIYYVGICHDISNSSTPQPSICTTTTGHDGKATSSLAPAYQVSKASNNWHECHRLGGSVGVDVPEWDLLWGEGSKPSQGVSLKYTGGDTCLDPKTGDSKKRSIHLHFECSNTYSTHILYGVTVDEDVDCEYSVHLKHSTFCPRECPMVQLPTSGSAPCGQHGICDWDAQTLEARCFCNEGWHGPDCTYVGQPSPRRHTHAGGIVGGLIGGLVGGLIIGAGIYYYVVFIKDDGALAAEAGFAPSSSSGGPMDTGAGDIPGINGGYVAPSAEEAAQGDDDPML